MADIRRIVTLDSTGTPTTVKDLGDNVSYIMVRDSWTIVPPAAQSVQAKRQRRYGGSRTVAQSHDNGAIQFTVLVTAANANACLLNVETALTVLESPRVDLFFEWRPDGATSSVFYEIRGPATWKSVYSWVQFTGAISMYVEVTIPVAPLCRVAPVTYTHGALFLPQVINLSPAVAGDAPALVDVTVAPSGGTTAPSWAMIAWTKRPTTPIATTDNVFGIIEAETADTLSTLAVVGSLGATHRGSSGLRVTTAGAGSGTATWKVDPSTVDPDDFTDTVSVEVWARVELASTVVSPLIRVSSNRADPSGSAVASSYTHEYGSVGKRLVSPSSGTVLRPMRLGTLTFPVRPSSPPTLNLTLDLSWAAGSTGSFGLDYLWLVLARSRALLPTGKALDGTYPKFVQSTTATTRTVRSDLSGLAGESGQNVSTAPSLGGSMIELPPGNVDMLVKLSSVVPDDPTSSATTEQITHPADVIVSVWPRYWIAKGA